MTPAFELGINYWPRRSAMYMWRELDLSEVRDEMAHIADMGFEIVRVFALTEDFLPGPTTVATDKVAQLVQVVDAAREARLRVVPTLIVLNMSGRIWWPSWMHRADGTLRDLFSDDALLRAQALLVDACARALTGDAAIRAFDIANEIDDALRPHSREAACHWAGQLAETIRHAAPGTPIQIGAHLPSLTTDNNMRVDDLAGVADEDVARLRHHADFDAAGLVIGNLLARTLGATPWRFGAADYRRHAPRQGRRLGTVLVPAAWDAELAPAMAENGHALDEEAMADLLIADLQDAGQNPLPS